MKYQGLLVTVSVMGLIAACNTSSKRTANPDEFAVVKKAPLEAPPAVVSVENNQTVEEVTVTATRRERHISNAPFTSDGFFSGVVNSAQGERAFITLAAPNEKAQDRERYEDAAPNPVKLTTETPVSTFSIDVDTASYAVARRYLEQFDMIQSRFGIHFHLDF